MQSESQGTPNTGVVDLEPLLTPQQLAQAFGITEAALGRLRRRHGLPTVFIGGLPRFERSRIAAWLVEHTVEGKRAIGRSGR